MCIPALNVYAFNIYSMSILRTHEAYPELHKILHCWCIGFPQVIQLRLSNPFLFADAVPNLYRVVAICCLSLNLHSTMNLEIPEKLFSKRAYQNQQPFLLERSVRFTCVTMFPSSRAMTEAGMAKPSLKNLSHSCFCAQHSY